MLDGVAFTVAAMYILTKAAHRQYTGKSAVRLDDVVGAAQLYAAIVTIRTRAAALPQVPVFGKEEEQA